jgi:hypothetical protein
VAGRSEGGVDDDPARAVDTTPDRRQLWIVVVGVLSLAALVRAPMVWGGLPYVHQPDEITNVHVAERMVRQDDLNPHFFNYPGLMFYLEAAIMEPAVDGADDAVPADRHRQEALTSQDQVLETQTVANSLAVRPDLVVALRWVVGIVPALFAVAAAMAIGWRATRVAWVAGLAGLFVTLSPLGLRFGTSITPDSLASATSGLAVLAAIWILDRPRTANYALAGAAVGAAAAAKYNAALTVVALGVAHLFVAGLRPSRRTVLVAAAALVGAVGAFVVLNPYALLDPHGLVAGLRYERHHYQTGHPGNDGDAPIFYASWLFGWLGPILLLLPFALVAPSERARRCVAVALSFSVAYVLFVSSFNVRFARNLLPVLAPLAAVAAIAIFSAVHQVTTRWDLRGALAGRSRWALTGACAVAVLAWLAVGAERAFDDATADPWARAQAWMERNVPAGSHIAVETYGFYVDPQRYTVMARPMLYPDDAAWYEANGVDFLVASERVWMRFIDDPSIAPGQTAAYRNLLAKTCTSFASDEPRGERLLILDPTC